MNIISVIKGIKTSQSVQTEKLKESNKILNEAKEFFNKISEEISLKSDSIEKYEKKVKNDLKNFNIEKQNLEKNFLSKSQNAEELKKSYLNTEKLKYQALEKVKNYFEEFSKEEIKFLKLKSEENDLQIQLRNEENSEKTIALEIEHLKSINMMEIQKIEELKQEIDKSKNLRDYLKKEIDELEEKLKNADDENKQNQIEYELKKNELEEKLNELKSEMKNEEILNKEEKQKYSQIEADIKNKISYVTLQNFNVLEPENSGNNSANNGNAGKEKNYRRNLSEPNVNDTQPQYSFRENIHQNQNENIQMNMNSGNLQVNEINPSVDENSLKKQILMLLKKIND